MSPEQKRALFPLRGPRWQSLAFWPVDVFCAAVDGYYAAFFMAQPQILPLVSLTPAGSDR